MELALMPILRSRWLKLWVTHIQRTRGAVGAREPIESPEEVERGNLLPGARRCVLPSRLPVVARVWKAAPVAHRLFVRSRWHQ